MSVNRKHLYAIIDQMSEKDFAEVEKMVIDFRAKQFQKYLDNIPYDDEPLTAEEIRDIEVSLKEIELGQTISHEDLKKELGLC